MAIKKADSAGFWQGSLPPAWTIKLEKLDESPLKVTCLGVCESGVAYIKECGT